MIYSTSARIADMILRIMVMIATSIDAEVTIITEEMDIVMKVEVDIEIINICINTYLFRCLKKKRMRTG